MKKAIQDVPAKVKKLQSRAVKINRTDIADIKSFDRLTFTGHFTFEHFGEAPIAQDFRMQSMMEHTYQPVIRRLMVDSKESPIDPQWVPVEHTGYLILENRAGTGMLTTPTVEELEELSKQVVRIRYKGESKGFRLRPGKLFMADPEDVSSLLLKAVNAPVNVNLYLFAF